jgi:hypothetical protein
VADKTRGIAYGPALVGRFITVEGSRLKLFYMLSTWNPYAIVMMESDFQINCGSPICASGPGDGRKPPGSPNPNPPGGKTNPL